MSIENAILELAKSITFHAEVLREINQPIITQQEAKNNDVSFDQPKQRKSKKSEVPLTGVNVEINSTETIKHSEPVSIIISNPSVVTKPEEEVKVGEVVVKPAVSDKVTVVPGANNTITSEMCKNLAIVKMAAGVARNKIKGLVTEMGAESIADLTERNLVEFYTKLQALK